MPLKLPYHPEIARLMRDPNALHDEMQHLRRGGGHYDPNQPRVPRGNHDGGQWTRDPLGGTSHVEIQPEFVRDVPGRPPIPRVGFLPALLALFAELLSRQSPQERELVEFEFNAREFLRDPAGTLESAKRRAKVLNRDEVRNECRLDDVQRRTDVAASAVALEEQVTGKWLTPTQRGTAIHTTVAREINSMKLKEYRAEVSFIKMRDDGVYGEKGSIRVDILEYLGKNLVCVYDLKTGSSKKNILTLERMHEIVQKVLDAYPLAQRIIITEVRPRL